MPAAPARGQPGGCRARRRAPEIGAAVDRLRGARWGLRRGRVTAGLFGEAAINLTAIPGILADLDSRGLRPVTATQLFAA